MVIMNIYSDPKGLPHILVNILHIIPIAIHVVKCFCDLFSIILYKGKYIHYNVNKNNQSETVMIDWCEGLLLVC